MEWEGVDTHFAQTEPGFLDSCDQCTILCMSWMICWTCESKTKSHKFVYGQSFFFLKKLKYIFICKKKKKRFVKVLDLFLYV